MSIPVRFECTDKNGWVFVSPWPMTQKALDDGCRKALVFYTRLYEDFKRNGRPEDAETIEKALYVLRTNRVRNIVDQTMVDDLELQNREHELVINFPGVPRDI